MTPMMPTSHDAASSLQVLMVGFDSALHQAALPTFKDAGYRLTLVSLAEAKSRLREPDMAGVLLREQAGNLQEVLETLRSAKASGIPKIVVSSAPSLAAAVLAIKAGAADYLELNKAAWPNSLQAIGAACAEEQTSEVFSFPTETALIHQVLEQLPFAVMYYDCGSHHTFTNLPWEQLLTSAVADTAASSSSGLLNATTVQAADQPSLLEFRQQSHTTLQGSQLEYRVTSGSASGAEIWLLETVVPRLDALGQAAGYFHLVQEITRFKVAEQLYAESSKSHRYLLDRLPVGIVEIDDQGNVVYLNNYSRDPTDQIDAPNTRLGVNVLHSLGSITIHEDGSPCLPEDYPATRCLKTGEPSAGVVGFRLRDQTYRWGHFSAIPHACAEQKDRVLLVYTDITSFKRLEQQTQRHNELLQTVFDHIPIMLGIWGGGENQVTNQAWKQGLGWSPKEFESDEFAAQIFPQCPTGSGSPIQGLLHSTSAVPQWHELLVRTKDDREIFTKWSFIQLSDGSHLALGEDITLQNTLQQQHRELLASERQARTTAERSEANYRLLAESLPQIVWCVVPPGTITYVNEHWYSYTGLPKNAALDQQWQLVVHADDIQRVLDAYVNNFQTETAFEIDYRIRNGSSGEYRWFLARVSPVFDHGTLSYWLGTALDVHDRNQALVALRDSESLMRAFANNLPFEFSAIDLQGRFLMQNKASVQRWGKIVGKLVSEIALSTEEFEAFNHDYQCALQGEVVRSETEAMLHDRVRTNMNVFAPIFDGTKISGIIRVSIDISDRKEAEQRAHHLLSELSHVARLSTMGTMVTELAHEINQPLYAISNFAEACAAVLRKNNYSDHHLADWIQKILAQSKRAAEIIRRLGQFIQKSPSSPKPVDINLLVHEVLNLLHADRDFAQISLTLQLAPKIPYVLVDSVQIQQVLVNLLLNAAQSMQDLPSDQKHLRICTSVRGQELIEVSVQDTGSGISSEVMQRLFEPYYTTKPQGMGMGLVISQSIIEAHEGRLWVTSNDNKHQGTTFYFTLPIISAKETP